MDEDGHWAKKPFLRLDLKGEVIERAADTQKNCGNCMWWIEQGSRTKDVDFQPTVIGWCKRFPHTETDKDKDDWCGEFDAKK